MKLASAQINCTVGEVQKNLDEHYKVIELAIDNNVQLITFPEMSLTGYCREEAKELAFDEYDIGLNKLKELASIGNIIIVAGAPVYIKQRLYIGSFVIHPSEPIMIYTKQFLHNGEDFYFSTSFNYNPIINLEDETIGLAICADINNEKHPQNTMKNKCSIYLPSIFYSKNGMNMGFEQLRDYAQKYSLNILMSNYVGKLWGMESGGKSAFWNSEGELVDNLNSNDNGILIIEKENTEWRTQKMYI